MLELKALYDEACKRNVGYDEAYERLSKEMRPETIEEYADLDVALSTLHYEEPESKYSYEYYLVKLEEVKEL